MTNGQETQKEYLKIKHGVLKQYGMKRVGIGINVGEKGVMV